MNISIMSLGDAFWFYIGMTLFVLLGIMFILMIATMMWAMLSSFKERMCVRFNLKNRKRRS